MFNDSNFCVNCLKVVYYDSFKGPSAYITDNGDIMCLRCVEGFEMEIVEDVDIEINSEGEMIFMEKLELDHECDICGEFVNADGGEESFEVDGQKICGDCYVRVVGSEQ